MRLFVVDLDGTLLRRDGTIHEEDIDAVRRLRAGGVVVSIATGRMYRGSEEAARALELDGPIACVDGSHVVHAGSGRELFRASIEGGDVEHLRAAVREHREGSAAFVFTTGGIVHDERGAPFAPYVRTWSPDVACVDDLHEHDCWEHEHGVLAVVSVGVGEAVPRLASSIESRLPGAQAITFPIDRIEGGFGMVARARGHDKGTAIRRLAEHHGLHPREVAVVGDWWNDAPMFRVAGRSFVMAQAPAEVRALATDRLEASGKIGGGVAEAARAVRPDLF